MAARFDTVGEYYARTAAPTWGNFSACGRVYLTNDRNAIGTFFGMVDSTVGFVIALVLDTDGTTLGGVIGAIGGTTPTTGTRTSLSTGVWYDVGITYDGTTLRVYLGAPGVAMALDSSVAVTLAKTTLLYEINDAANWYDGRASAWKIWSGRVLTAAEFQEERYTVATKNTANLFAEYRLLAGARTTDSSGNGNTLTENGTVSDEADPVLPGALTKLLIGG